MPEITFSTFLLFCFLIVNLVLGFLEGKEVKTVAEYAIGNKKFGSFALSATFLATIIGGGAIYGTSKRLVYAGIFALTGFVFTSISYILIGFLLTNQIYRFSDCLTFGDFIGKTYGNTAKCFCGFISSINCIFNVALSIQILESIFSFFFRFDSFMAIIFSTIVITIYTAFGGMRSVVATDILQYVMIVVTFFALMFFSINVWADHGAIKFNFFSQLFPTNYPLSKAFSGEFATRASVLLFLAKFVDVPCFQRLLMAKNRNAAKKMHYYSALVYMIVGIMLLIIVFLGMAIFGEELDVKNPFNFIIAKVIPAPIIPIVGLGVLAIIFSSGDSWLHSAGLSLSKDFLEPILKRDIKLIEIRIITFLCGGLSMAIVLWFNGLLNLSSLFYLGDPIMAVPVLYGFLGFKSSFKMFFASALAGVFGAFVANSIPNLKDFVIILSCFSSLFVYFAVHYYENKGFKFVGNPILPYKVKKLKKLKDLRREKSV